MFADRLARILKERGIDKKTMLSDLGLGKNQFVYWKSNGTTPNHATVERIAKYLNVPEAYLLGISDGSVAPENPEKQELKSLIDQMTDDEAEALMALAKFMLKDRY